MGSQTFNGCTSLQSITVESGNANFVSVEGVLFNKDVTTIICCPKVKGGTYTVPTSVTSIGDQAFEACALLKSVNLPAGLKSIGSQAFASCRELTALIIPNGVTTIGTTAFSGCSSLASVVLPSSLTSIGSTAFANCTALTSFYSKTPTPCSVNSMTFFNVPLASATLYVPTGSRQAYAEADYWKEFAFITEMDFSVKGDINGDGNVDVSDVAALINIILNAD